MNLNKQIEIICLRKKIEEMERADIWWLDPMKEAQFRHLTLRARSAFNAEDYDRAKDCCASANKIRYDSEKHPAKASIDMNGVEYIGIGTRTHDNYWTSEVWWGCVVGPGLKYEGKA